MGCRNVVLFDISNLVTIIRANHWRLKCLARDYLGSYLQPVPHLTLAYTVRTLRGAVNRFFSTSGHA